MTTIFYPVSRKGETRVAKCDMEDWLKFKSSKRTVQTCSSGKKPWYIAYRLNGKRTQLHRLIANCPSGMYVDHINNDSLDNRKSNLRIVTTSQNNQNVKARKYTSSKYKGVDMISTSKWRGRIVSGGKYFNLGIFETENEAGLAYNKKSLELFGEYSYQNIIKE